VGHHDLVELSTDRLILRRWNPEDPVDVETAFDIYRRDEIARWVGPEPKPWTSLDHAREKLQAWQAFAAEQPGLGLWAISVNRHDPPLGTVLLTPLPDGDGQDTTDIEIGWDLHPDHWGHGYATEAAQRLIEHAWEQELPEVNAVMLPGNDRSMAVMRRLGMAPQGTTDRWYGVTLDWWLLGAPLPPVA
jgi:RimJ/RimL family protein N-acetyltransferase